MRILPTPTITPTNNVFRCKLATALNTSYSTAQSTCTTLRSHNMVRKWIPNPGTHSVKLPNIQCQGCHIMVKKWTPYPRTHSVKLPNIQRVLCDARHAMVGSCTFLVFGPSTWRKTSKSENTSDIWAITLLSNHDKVSQSKQLSKNWSTFLKNKQWVLSFFAQEIKQEKHGGPVKIFSQSVMPWDKN